MLNVLTLGPATLICGDVLRQIDKVDAVDAVITDPPYSSGGTHASDRALPPAQKYCQAGSSNQRLPNFGGDNRDQRSFVLFNTLWASQALDRCAPGGVIATFTYWRQLAVTTDYVQAGGWVWRGIVAWTKPQARPQRGRFAASCEYAVWGSNGPMPFDRGVPPLPGHFNHAAPRSRQHITQKPVSLMEDLVSICTPGGTVFDPFMGSGTTGIAAIASGRKFVGIEKSPELFFVARDRIRAALEYLG